MKQISKKLLCLFVALVISASIGACKDLETTESVDATNTPDATSASTEIPTLQMWFPPSLEKHKIMYRRAIREAEEEFNVKIEEGFTEGSVYKAKIKSAMAIKGGPDIFFAQWTDLYQTFVDEGKVLALDQYLGEAKGKLLTGITDYSTYDGKVYGVPYQMQVVSLYCNTELFEKYNVKIPETYEELLTAVRTFSKNGVTPIICGAKDFWVAMYYYNVLALRTAGADSCNNALLGKGSFDSPEFIDAAKKFAELIEAGAFNKNVMKVSWDNANDDFAQGKGAMFFNHIWVADNVSEETSKVNGKITARKFPIIEGGKGSATEYLGGACDGYMINSETKYPELSAKVVFFICEKLAHDMYEANLGLPAWKVQVDESKILPLRKEICDMTKDSTGWTLWWDAFFDSADAEIFGELLEGQITPEKFAKEMQKINKN